MLTPLSLTLALLAAPVLAAPGAPTSPASRISAQALPAAGRTEGKLRVIQVVHARTASGNQPGDPYPVELQVYRVSDGALLQRLYTALDEESAESDQAPIRFLDLDDDGHQDLLFRTSRPPFDGATGNHDVFLWSPALERFVLNADLSQAGEVAKNSQRGCVDVVKRCDTHAFSTATYCAKPVNTTWELLSTTACPNSSR